MSRHLLQVADTNHEVVVGWDNQLETFFAQVWDARNEEQESCVLWAGCYRGEVPSVDSLAALVRPNTEIPQAAQERLEANLAHHRPAQEPEALAEISHLFDEAVHEEAALGKCLSTRLLSR
jgi:hypothetical protein